jgi:hypothetical protein
MYKYLLIFFILFFIIPANAIENVAPSTTCKPTFIYVTVTPSVQPTQQIIYVPVTQPIQPSNTKVTSTTMIINNIQYIIYGILLIIIIFLFLQIRKNKPKPKLILDVTTNVDELYEENNLKSQEKIQEKIQEHSKEGKIKKLKKVNSLLDQDFEF